MSKTFVRDVMYSISVLQHNETGFDSKTFICQVYLESECLTYGLIPKSRIYR